MKFYPRLFVCAAVLLGALLAAHLKTNDQRVSAQTSGQTSSVSFKTREDAYRANNLGVALLEQFKHREATEQFRRALMLDPNLKIAQINLAIALFNLPDYENALREAQKFSEIATDKPQPFYIIGLIARTQNRPDDAIAAFKKVLEFDARDVGANVNLGQIYMQQRRYDEAATAFRSAIEAEPYNATALYNLATALLRGTSRDEGQRLMTRFQSLRQSGAATNIGLNYLEQGRYAEALVSTGAESELVDKSTPKVVFREVAAGIRNKSSIVLPLRSFSRFQIKPQSKYQILKEFAGGETLLDFDGDGKLDLARIDNSITNYRKISRQSSTAKTTTKISLYRNVGGKFSDATLSAGDLAKPVNSIGTSLIAGDFDNDNLTDILLVGYKDLRLYRNEGKGKFKDVSAQAKLPKYPFLSVSSAFVDADHDGDLDVFIAGFTDVENEQSEANDFAFPSEYGGAPDLLLRNNGDGTFTDVSDAAKINDSVQKGNAEGRQGKSVSIVPLDYDNRRDVDLLILNYQGEPSLLRNLRDGSFREAANEANLKIGGNWSSLAVGDFNKDGFVDFFFGKSTGWDDKNTTGTLAVSDGSGKFTIKSAPKGTEEASAAQFLDYDNDGLLDLIVSTPKGLLISRNLGSEFAGATAQPFKQISPLRNASKILSADLDGDGDLDLIVDGRVLRNDGGSANNSEIVRLAGRVSNKNGVGAKIDVRAGSLAQKLESYSASPMPAPSDIHFGLGKREKPDAVRVIWTSGVIQSEVEFAEQVKNQNAARRLTIEELDRKPSSCPYLYAWNGEKFEFITDFLGGGEMAYSHGDGQLNTPDPDEYVRITSDQLKPRNGRYELRVTNELEEVLYLDRFELLAVDHAENTEIYPNEGLGIPTAGKFVLYETRNEKPVLKAVDGYGNDVTERLRATDRTFYDTFENEKIRGYAKPHELVLTLDDKPAARGKTLLLMTGWTDYAFSSDNVAAAQSGLALQPPKLQVRNRRGEWETVIESIGISVGRPQTIVVDLTGKFLSSSREVRILTNMKTLWDKIAVDTSANESAAPRVSRINPRSAELRERGFSLEIKPDGKEPILVDYERILNDGRWKYFSGDFTRTGDILPLLKEPDDVFVISKTGDETALSFAESDLPLVTKGMKRTFLLYAVGYSKEMDINSASPDAVLPLPFQRMTKYPYGADEQFPMTEEKRRIYDEYTTRRVRGVFPRIETALIK